ESLTPTPEQWAAQSAKEETDRFRRRCSVDAACHRLQARTPTVKPRSPNLPPCWAVADPAAEPEGSRRDGDAGLKNSAAESAPGAPDWQPGTRPWHPVASARTPDPYPRQSPRD